MQQLSITECIRFGWETFKKRPWFFVGVYAAFFLVSGSFSYASETVPDMSPALWVFVGIFGIFATVASVIVGTIAEIATANLALQGHEHPEKLTVSGLFSPLPFLYYFAVKIVSGFVIFLGLLALIVPGITFLVMFIFAPYIVVDRGMGPIEAMKESARITKGFRWQILGLVGALTLLNIVGLLALLIGMLVTVPVSTLALVHAYRFLEHRVNELASRTSTVTA